MRWWYASWLACACACASACGVAPDTTIDVTFDACAPIAIAMPADGVRAAGVRAAFALWGLVPGPGEPRLDLVFEDAAEAFHGLYDDEHAVIYINAKITAPAPLAIVLAHELGHAMGLPHVDEPSIMRSGNTTVAPTAADAARLAALWGPCASAPSE